MGPAGVKWAKEEDLNCEETEGHFTPKKISYTFGKNPFVFKKNPSKIRVNPLVLKKSRTLFPMSEVPLGRNNSQLGWTQGTLN